MKQDFWYNMGEQATRCPALLVTAGAMVDSYQGAADMPIIPHAKRCRACNTVKPSPEFSRNKSAKDGLQIECKLCQRARMREYRATHPDYKSQNNPEYQREYYQRNRRHVLDRMARAYDADPNKFKTRRQRYESTPAGKAARRSAYHNYQARKRGRKTALYSSADVLARFSKFDNACAFCGATKNLHLDHFLPLSVNGTDCIGNIIPACASCNTSKQDADPYIWYRSRPFFRLARWRFILKVLGKTQSNYNQAPLL